MTYNHIILGLIMLFILTLSLLVYCIIAFQLVIGDYGLSYDQQRVQMALYAILASPLIMSVDLGSIDLKSKELLLNKYVIAINQDEQHIQGRRVKQVSNCNKKIYHKFTTEY